MKDPGMKEKDTDKPQHREEESVEWSVVSVIGGDGERMDSGESALFIESPLPLRYAQIGVFGTRRAGSDILEGCQSMPSFAMASTTQKAVVPALSFVMASNARLAIVPTPATMVLQSRNAVELRSRQSQPTYEIVGFFSLAAS